MKADIGDRMLLRNRGFNRLQFGHALLARDAWPQPSDGREIEVADAGPLFPWSEIRIEEVLGAEVPSRNSAADEFHLLWKIEGRRQDANHRSRISVQKHLLSHDLRSGAETPAP